MNKRKLLAPFLMLFAGAVASIAMFRLRYELGTMLGILLLILVVFYVIGFLITKMLDKFERQNEEAITEEGEVIEKEMGDETENSESIIKDE